MLLISHRLTPQVGCLSGTRQSEKQIPLREMTERQARAGADSLAGNNGKKGKSKSSRFFGLPNEERLLGVSAIVERMEQLCRLWRQPSTVL